jgi:uncharacterized membrane protein
MKKLVRYFLQGVLFIAPTGITLYIVYLVFTFLDDLIQNFISGYLPVKIPGLGILAILILITLLGFLAQSIIFRPIRNLIDRVMNHAPLIKVIYSAIKDLLSAFVGKEKKFNQPVLVRVNLTSNLEKMGFITQTNMKDLFMKDKVVVYFPHSYNFSGEMFIVPKDQVTLLDIPATEAMKFIVSGGASMGW